MIYPLKEVESLLFKVLSLFQCQSGQRLKTHIHQDRMNLVGVEIRFDQRWDVYAGQNLTISSPDLLQPLKVGAILQPPCHYLLIILLALKHFCTAVLYVCDDDGSLLFWQEIGDAIQLRNSRRVEFPGFWRRHSVQFLAKDLKRNG